VSDAVLAIRLRALGDVVLTTPALRALHRGAPGATIDVVTEARYAPLLEGLPGVGRVIGLARGGGPGLAMPDAVRAVRARRYARAVDFFGNPRSALLTAASRAPATYGYDLRGRRNAYRHRVARDVPPVAGRLEYAAASHVRLAVAAGGVADGLRARVTVSEAARAQATELLAAAGVDAPSRTLGLVPAGTWGTKTWPPAHMAWFARHVLASGRALLALTGPGEDAVTRTLVELAPGTRVLPPCDVPALAAVIERLAGVVGTDSGPRHLAAALGRPTFAWFAPTHPDNWTPPGEPMHGTFWSPVPCRGCNRTACPHWVCLPTLHPDAAFALADAHFRAHAAEPA